jgi:uncharacterized protein YbaP (TraB family)
MKRNYPLLITLLLSLSIMLNFQAAIAQAHKSLLWQITGKGITQPTYLFGTVHMYDTSLYRLPKAAFDKVRQVKQVYFELDFDKIDQMQMMQAIFVKDSSQRLDKLLNAKDLAKLNTLAQRSPVLKMMGSRMYSIKPLFLTAFLINNGKAASIDMELYKAAKRHTDDVGGLEIVREQLAAIDAIPVNDQAKMLAASLDKFTSPEAMLRNLTSIYVKQDIDHLLQEMNDNMPLDDNFNTVLLKKRNVVMDTRIEAMLGKQSLLVAVGSGHLGGSDGLIALLKKHGYTLKSLPVTFVKAN